MSWFVIENELLFLCNVIRIRHIEHRDRASLMLWVCALCQRSQASEKEYKV